MEWYNYVTLAIFLYIVFSPVWFFKQVEKFILNNDAEESQLYITGYVHPMNIMSRDIDDTLEQDERILNNFNRIIKSSKKRDVKKLWKIKKAEHLRNMRWKTLGGMEKTSYGQHYHPETYS